jgi:hypothetical protein
MIRATSLFLLSLAGLPLLRAADGDITVIRENGSPGNRVDIVYLGDGYTSVQQDTYAEHVASMNAYLFTANHLVDPLPRYANFFNTYRIEVNSVQSGADDPTAGTYVNTALNATYATAGIQRLLTVDTGKASTFLPENTGKGFSADIRFVTVNSNQYGGSGGSYPVYAGGNGASREVAVHELGHSFAQLGDEYGGSGAYIGGEPTQRNVTKDSTGAKWARWLGYVDPHTGVVDAFEGGNTFDTGLYHPSGNTKMRELGNAFDPISKEAFIGRIYDFVKPVDSFLANTGTLTDPAKLWVKSVDAAVFTFKWYVDDVLVAGATGEEFITSNYDLITGIHTIRASISDDTDMVRDPDILAKMNEDISWTVNLVAIPEPATWGFIAAAGLPLILRTTRRRRENRDAA